MRKRVVLTKLGDLVYYPPVLSILKTLNDLDCEVIYIGVYSDGNQKRELKAKGIKFIDTVNYLPEYNIFKKLIFLFQYQKTVKREIENLKLRENDVLWIFNADTICLLSTIVSKYKTVLHFFEFVEAQFNWKYKLVNPTYNFKETLHSAWKIVHCEYNRAHITKGLYQLDVLPYILPNKPYEEIVSLENASIDVKKQVEYLQSVTKNKKVILYQGIFNSKQRKLREFCEATNILDDEYMLLVMGRGNDELSNLKKQFESSKIVFVPFIKPPYHMLVTRLCSVGILSYYPTSGSYAEVINPIYCAPNKLYEYSKFGIPMISNDIPGLKYIFQQYNCGRCVNYPMTSVAIAECIKLVFRDYKDLSEGSRVLYESVDIQRVVNDIIN